MNKPSKTNIRTFVRFNNRTFECGKYTFVPALTQTVTNIAITYRKHLPLLATLSKNLHVHI